jgi:hypothetical protein
MADLSARLIHKDCSVITISDGCQDGHKMEILGALRFYHSLFLFSSFSLFLILVILRSPNSSSIHSILMYNSELNDMTQNDRQTPYLALY